MSSAKVKRESLIVPSGFSLRPDATQQLCNFESFSLHFDLPLKAAAEKFGVRATAFKKRCRAIGIRHWPYRKVRSLKRSIQELSRCKENGSITEKQRYQHIAFKRQLDRLMSPQTYGLDPSGRILCGIPEDDDSSSEGSPSDINSVHHSPDYIEEPYFNCLDSDRSPGTGLPSFNDTMSPVFRKTAQPNFGGMKNTSQFGLTLQYPGTELGSIMSPHKITTSMCPEECKESDGTDVKVGDDFHEALESMDYGNEKHFLDDLFVELSPIYDCKV